MQLYYFIRSCISWPAFVPVENISISLKHKNNDSHAKITSEVKEL